ncbi:LacI family DNA-binding transcriptional regulator [Kiritimatiellaeota bacterium B1221]|nr:LacI family DNA-binding transcriptional regulator [Kiritimatiellaeota bacterium B1221]
MNRHIMVSMADIAKKAGVSVNTVSLSLKNSHRVKKETKEKILTLANEMGYQTDPLIRRLMMNIRTQKAGTYRATIGVLDFLSKHAPDWKKKRVEHGFQLLQKHAQAWGYQTELLSLSEWATFSRIEQVLDDRGIHGILIISSPDTDSSNHLSWDKFSTVTLSPSLFPHHHQVMPDFYTNVLMALSETQKRGYRRIGLIEPQNTNINSRYQFSSALHSFSQLNPQIQLCEPLFPALLEAPLLLDWYKHERPEVILSHSSHVFRWLQQSAVEIPGEVAFVNLDLTDGTDPQLQAGIDPCHDELYRRAVGLLVTMIEQNETGTPSSPTTTLVKGSWVDGESIAAL